MTNINVSRLYEAYCALPPSEQRSGTYLSNFRILYSERTSIVLGDKEQVIKIIPRDDAITAVEKEFKMLTLCRDIRGGSFVTPAPIAYGKNPNHLVMTRLEKPCGYISTEWDYQRVGQALGEFSAELWVRYGYIHDDLHPRNFTREKDGKVGVLDFESIKEPLTRVWYSPNNRKSFEEMFLPPLACEPGLAPYVASAFTERSGIPINFAWLTRLVNDQVRFMEAEWDHKDCEETVEIIESNLQKWKEHLANHRPAVVSRSSCALPLRRL